ncbi:DUF4136 domain-containing protein [Corallincola holothuriorum]|uniref:DUF4136 domain-containing protein n=1 Tax=Corallincola holothuriorum TaxID=2282215 RepID=A0A368N594_9GAMM|nr:DUF4136 domain-containing protein [Corallincola holothuriorum]RCU45193.1 DUF4136 domain-containing protein [Corallincola holothuriorum]
MAKGLQQSFLVVLLMAMVAACGDTGTAAKDDANAVPDELRKSVAVSIQSPELSVPARAMVTWSDRTGGVLGEVGKNPEIEGLLRESIVKNMDQQAYHFTEHHEQAFFKISYVLALEKDLNDADLEKYFGLSLGLAGDKGFDKGTLVIDIQNKEGQSVWRGALQANVGKGQQSEELRNARLNGAVQTLLDSFFRHKAG